MVDIYKDTVLPEGTLRPMAQAGKVNNPLEPLNDTANLLSRLDAQYKRVQLENEKSKQDQFESDLKLKQAQFNSELENINNQTDFDNAIAKYNSDIDSLGVSILGEKGYQKWSNTKGRNYKELSNLGYKGIWAKNMQKQTYVNMQTTVDNYANLASIDPLRRNAFVEQAKMDIDSKFLDPEQKEKLTNRFYSQLANAEAVRDINNNPGDALAKLKAVTKDKSGDITKDKPTYYDGLTPVQRQHYIEQAQNKYENQLNTYKDKKINKLKEQFNYLYENVGYDAAYNFLKVAMDNPDSTKKDNDITQEQLQSFISYAKGTLKATNTEYAIGNQEKFGDLQETVKGMGITFDKKKGEYKINNKKNVRAEDVIEAISNINTGLEDGSYYINEKKVKAMRDQLRTVLGNMVDKGIKLRDTDVEGNKWFKQDEKTGNFYYQPNSDTTTSEYIADSILKVLKNKTNVNNFNLDKLSARDKGEIFEHVYYSALANNIDLKSHYIDSKQKIDTLTQNVFNWMIQNRFDVPNNPYSAVVGDGNMYDTGNKKANANLGKKSVGVGNYVIDGKGTLKLVDEKGNIIDEVRQ